MTQTQFGFGNGLPSLDEFFQAQRDGWVLSKTRKTADNQTYRLFNYAKKTQYDRVWTPVTLEARGLIYCEETLELVASPLRKFFNLGERISDTQSATVLPGPFEALVKLDGSLGIGYRLDGAINWATRGSFDSPQSLAAQAIWDARYKKNEHLLFTEWNHITPMAEIIHPCSRVVVKYDFEDLVLIAARDRFTGQDLPYEFLAEMAQRVGMPVVERFSSSDMDSILQRVSELDSNHEGVVLHWPEHRLKLKGDEYKRVHALLSGATTSNVASSWLNGTHVELLEAIPEEHRETSEKTLAELDERLVASILETEDAYTQAPECDQREFASWVNKNHKQLAGRLFNRRLFDRPEHVDNLVANAIASAVQTGQVHSLLSESRHETLLTHLQAYEQSVGSLLWHYSRDVESRPQFQDAIKQMPNKALRSALGTAVSALQPETAVAKLEAFLNQPEQQALFGNLDVNAIFAAAPSPDSPIELHWQWVSDYSPHLRSFLDRWRYCGQRQSATVEARSMLAAAIRSNCVAEAAPCQIDCSWLSMSFANLGEEIKGVWQSIPHQDGSLAMLQFARNSKNPWVRILLNQAWSTHRDVACYQFLAQHKNDSSPIDDEG